MSKLQVMLLQGVRWCNDYEAGQLFFSLVQFLCYAKTSFILGIHMKCSSYYFKDILLYYLHNAVLQDIIDHQMENRK